MDFDSICNYTGRKASLGIGVVLEDTGTLSGKRARKRIPLHEAKYTELIDDIRQEKSDKYSEHEIKHHSIIANAV